MTALPHSLGTFPCAVLSIITGKTSYQVFLQKTYKYIITLKTILSTIIRSTVAAAAATHFDTSVIQNKTTIQRQVTSTAAQVPECAMGLLLIEHDINVVTVVPIIDVQMSAMCLTLTI